MMEILDIEEAFWLKIWNADFNMVSRGFGKQRWTYQVKNTVSDIVAVLGFESERGESAG